MLAVAGLAGFALGALAPAWQVALEPAQTLAGVVSYPAGNPVLLYQKSLWTVWHQVLAPLLEAGVGERALTIAVSGLLGALAFAGLAALALGFGAGAALALACPFFVLFLDPAGWGFRYPILLLGAEHTYGMAGLSWVVLVCGLFAAGRTRVAAFSLGLAPAIHASLGAWLCLIAGLCALAGLRGLRAQIRGMLVSGTIGAVLAAASLGVHALTSRPAARAAPALDDLYLDAFVRLWDAHRQPVDLMAWNAFLVWCGLGAALALLRQREVQLSAPSRLGLRIFFVSGALALVLSSLQRWLPPESIPNAILIAMPTRLLNFDVLACAPLVLGLSWRFRDDALARAILAALTVLAVLRRGDPGIVTVGLPLACVGLIVVIARRADTAEGLHVLVFGLLGWLGLRLLWQGGPLLGLHGAAALTLLLLGGAAAYAALLAVERFRARRRAATPALHGRGGAALGPLRAATAWIATTPELFTIPTALALVVAALAVSCDVVKDSDARFAALRDRLNSPVFAAASNGSGVLATGVGIQLVQLRSRRPVLLAVEALDMLPYALAAGPELQRILAEVYGVDFFHPPRDALHTAAVPEQPSRAVWERRTPAEWAGIKARFGVSEVLVAQAWRLALPEIARSDGLVLYRIP